MAISPIALKEERELGRKRGYVVIFIDVVIFVDWIGFIERVPFSSTVHMQGYLWLPLIPQLSFLVPTFVHSSIFSVVFLSYGSLESISL